MRLLRALAPVVCVLAVLVTRPAPLESLRSLGARLADAAEGPLHRSLGDEHVICRLYLDPHDKFTRVVAPRRSFARTAGAEANAQLSNITVNYTGFTGSTGAEAQAAFQAAVDIWETQVASSVPIVVDAAFADLGSGGLLGHAGSFSTANFTNAPRANTWFPFPLANKIAGSDLGLQFPQQPNISHIEAEFNNNAQVNWSYDLNGTMVPGKVDFMSVVMHELGHGLGFFGGANVESGSGSIGASGLPYIYDTFAVDAPTVGNSLIDATVYPNPGAALASALTGNSEYWSGTNGMNANGGGRPRLYAPTTFSQGSSHSHLNEATYLAGNINSLMTPSIGSAEIAHTPGPIVLGMFADMGWGSSTTCTFALSATTATVPAAGAALNVTLSTGTGCGWSASTAASFVTIGPAATGSGTTVFTLTVAANTNVSARTATVSIGGQTLQITQNGTGPTMSLDKTSLIFSAVNNGAAFTSQTPAQTVRMVQSGTGTATWTAASNVPWLVVSPASGSGSATFTISVQFASNLASTQTGSITLTLTGAGNSAGPITVTLNSLIAGAAAPPVGSFDTPIDQSTGVTGSIAVTGWAMDDVGVTAVRIWRNAVSPEPANSLVFVGNAVIVDGARPDVAGFFPSSPQNTRAGWGYLMLTNFLPNLGNGTFTLYAIATDAEGHSTTLGSKTITCTNASATAPFGAIDTPEQGGTATGTVLNFGWVLSRTPAFANPTQGGTVRIAIDGALIATVPGSWGARSDLTALFPATEFPGITNALGVAALNTTTLTNGVHTIAWIVTDNLGVASGIGSRYFTVSNGSSLQFDPDAAAVTSSSIVSNAAMLQMPRAAALRGGTPRALADEIAAASADHRPISGRRGYSDSTPLRRYRVVDGVSTVQSEELDRIELRLGGGQGLTGYVRSAGGLAPLPIGSALNASTGVFTWQPGVGFVGNYDLAFVRWAGGRAISRQDVRIVLNPKGSNRVGPQVVIDVPAPAKSGSADGGRSFLVAGWAADLDSTIDGGVDTVHVWAYPARGGDPIFIGAAAYGGSRPDVAAIYGDRFGKSGYGIEVKGLSPGDYDIAVFAYSTVSNGFVPAKIVRIGVR